MRALLVHNPTATRVSHRTLDAVTAALRARVDLVVASTRSRDHASDLAAEAVADGVDVVFAFGGDGTTNEVIQALARTPVALGLVPGGGTNVLARALGLPGDPVDATAVALDRLADGHRRRIGLGRANERWFAFAAGLGFDGAVVRRVEESPTLRRRFGQLAFVWLAGRTWFGDDDVHDPAIEVELSDGTVHGPYGIAIVGNTDPYTYLGPRPLNVTPRASFDTGLDLTAIRDVGTVRLLRIVGQVLTGGGHVAASSVDSWHDRACVRLRSPRPLALMVDGDDVGDHHDLVLEAVPDALTILI